MIRWIKSLFGIYDTSCEYWVLTNSIKVPLDYELTEIGKAKWERKVKYYFKTGEFESPILLHRDFSLVDGYTSVEIGRTVGLDKVPVYFVD